jgi:hypothetical protein
MVAVCVEVRHSVLAMTTVNRHVKERVSSVELECRLEVCRVVYYYYFNGLLKDV